tara:strand:- start:161 stop:2200 length:2040 start_codon:yes stop_codon:yes gene_type:complete
MAYSKNRRLAEIVSDTSGNLSVEGIVVPTQSSSDNDTSAASTAFVHAHIDAVLDSAPGTLNTLNEIAAALNDDANFNTTVTNSIAAKLPLAGGTMTGNIAHAGNFTLDVGGNLTLDSDGSHIIFADAGTEFGRFSNESSNLVLYSLVNDKDITLKGITGGSSFSALTLDMSAAGAATFNSTINGLTLAAGGISGPATQNFALNTPHSLRINIDSDNNATDQDFIIGNNQTAVNQSNVLFKVQENGNVGIGTSSPQAELDVRGNMALVNGSPDIYIGTTSASHYNWRIAAQEVVDTGFEIAVGTQSAGSSAPSDTYATKFVLMANGRCGIGTTNPSSLLHMESGNAHNKLSITSTASGGTGYDAVIDLLGSASNSEVQLNMGINGDADREQIKTYQSAMTFRTNNTERMRIDSSGNLLVGTTDTSLFNNTSGGGFSVGSNGITQIAKQGVDSADPVLLLNQTGLDGEILRFYKDGSAVGSIGTTGGDLTIGTGDTGLAFNDFVDAIYPVNTSGANRDNAVTLGDSAIRFKDLYLSGGVYIGGTGSANYLDDYEAGSWTPVLQNVTTSSISYYSLYTKIGRICHIHAKITATVTSLPGANFAISGLPFTAKDSSDSQQRAVIAIGGDSQNLGAYANGRAHFRTNGTQLQGVWLNSGSTAYWNYNSMDHTTFEIHLHGHYTV